MRLNFGPLPPPREWDRRDPVYDAPRPIDSADFRAMLRMVPFAVVFVIGAFVGMGIIIVQLGTPR